MISPTTSPIFTDEIARCSATVGARPGQRTKGPTMFDARENQLAVVRHDLNALQEAVAPRARPAEPKPTEQTPRARLGALLIGLARGQGSR